jgi:hypothetical protein
VLDVQQEEIDGVPVFWAETSSASFHAALIFRVGRADETMPRGGVSRLIQRLALSSAGPGDGFVDVTRTVFHADGERSAVLAFVSKVAAALSSLPLDRVDDERQDLRIAVADWRPSVADRLLTTRFGAQGFGTASYRELGLEWIDRDVVGAWAAEHFTRGNAALCMSGPPGGDLRLELPDGARRPDPALDPLPGLQYPVQHNEGEGGLAMAGLVERTASAAVALDIFNRRATAELGPERRVAHEVAPIFTALTAETAQLGFVGRAADEKAPNGRDGLMFVVEKLRDQGPAADELAAAVERATKALGGRAGELAVLDRAATAELDGREQIQPAELAERYAALTPDDVRTVFDEVAKTAVVIMPRTAEIAEGFHAPPGPLREVFTGREFKGRGLIRKPRLVVGADGVTHNTPDDGPLAVRFSDVVAVVQEGGDLSLLARDRSVVTVAEEFGDEAQAAVRSALPANLYVPDPGDRHHHHDHDHDHDAHDNHHHH